MEFNFSFEPLIEELTGWWDSAIRLLPNLVLAIVVLLIGVGLTRFLQKYFHRLAQKVFSNLAVANLAGNILTAVFGAFVLFLILGILQLDTALQSLLAGAGIIGLAVGLAFQDPLLNLFSGIMISTRDFFNVGDLVDIDGNFGKIRKISLRTTSLESLQGQEIVIPNRRVSEGILVNYSLLNKRRVDLSCGVSYGDNLENVKRITIGAIESEVEYDQSRPIQLFFNEFGNSSINYTLRFWLKKTDQAEYLNAQSQAIIAIKKAYDHNDITIPFPIRTLDFGIKGGEKLNQVLNGETVKTTPANEGSSN